jgi:hypothetical protein
MKTQASRLQPLTQKGRSNTMRHLMACCVISLIVISCTNGVTPGTGPTPTNTSNLTIPITKSCNDGYTTYVQFFDEKSGAVWPSATTGWTLSNGQTLTETISCTTGDQIAFGAADNGNNTLGYWSVGFGGRLGCSGCTYSCQNTTVTTFSLTCGAAHAIHVAGADAGRAAESRVRQTIDRAAVQSAATQRAMSPKR